MLGGVVSRAKDVHVCTFEGAVNFHRIAVHRKLPFSDTSAECVAQFEFLRHDRLMPTPKSK